MQPFSIVVAIDAKLGIGKTGALPWRLKADMKHFRELTMDGSENSVIMGRKTWESIPEKFRPLPGRTNVVLTRSSSSFAGAVTASDLDDALRVSGQKRFVIGGGEIYRDAINHPACTELWITKVGASFDCDVTFPGYEERFRLDSVAGRFAENSIECSIEHWIQR